MAEPALKYDETETEVLEAEFLQNVTSQRWRLDSLYHITNAKGERVSFVMNLVQLMLYLSLWFFNIVLKSRQHGVTTFFCVLFLDTCLWNSNTNACIVAHNKEDAEFFFYNNIRYAYKSLPEFVRAMFPIVNEQSLMMRFANGSSIRVTTSGRSGTYQLVHITELAKVCVKYPEKAVEIKTGTLNTIHAGQMLTIESTAEGREGMFFDYCQEAIKAQRSGKPLSKLDFKFFFFPWYLNPLNVLDPKDVLIYASDREYFKNLDAKHGIKLRPEQIAWYVKKKSTQGDYMKREHPSTPEEAFEESIEGAYYKKQFANIYKQKRITSVPLQPGIPVDTWWDIGFDDDTGIWFTQDVGREIHIIDYYENSGEGFGHYAKMLRDKKYFYGVHMAPHDAAVHEFMSGTSRVDTAKKDFGVEFEIAPMMGINAGIEMVRQLLDLCWFDEAKCNAGIVHLENYRKQWDDRLGRWKDAPFKDSHVHGADAFRTMGVCHKFGGMLSPPRSAAEVQQSRERAKRKAKAHRII